MLSPSNGGQAIKDAFGRLCATHNLSDEWDQARDTVTTHVCHMLERQSADGFRGHTHGDATNPTTYANIDHILNTHLATNGYLGAGAHHGYCQELLLGEGETGANAWQVAGLMAI